MRLSILGLALLALAGCATPPPPLLDLSSRACAASPDFITARPLVLSDPMRPDTVKLAIDDQTPCLETREGKSLYGAFVLPDSTQPFMIAVRSLPVGEGLFVPRLMLYDGTGALTREIGRDEAQFRGNTLTVLIRSHPSERYLVVASTPQSVGQEDTRITERTVTTTTYGRHYATSSTSGFDTASTFVYAHNGLIWVFAATIAQQP